MRNKRAFTLIEVIVSITTIVSIIGVGSMLVSSYNTTVQSNQASIVASGLAQELLTESYANRNKKPESPISVTFDKRVTLNNIAYARELYIDSVESGTQQSGSYWQATAKVKWSEAGKDREVVLITNISKLSK